MIERCLNDGYYCLMIAILRNVDAANAWRLYRNGSLAKAGGGKAGKKQEGGYAHP